MQTPHILVDDWTEEDTREERILTCSEAAAYQLEIARLRNELDEVRAENQRLRTACYMHGVDPGE